MREPGGIELQARALAVAEDEDSVVKGRSEVSVLGAELEGGNKNSGGNVEMAQMSNAPNGMANGA